MEPLMVMTTTGPAYYDHDGCIIESGEFVAALYESYAADLEYVEAMRERYGDRRTTYPVPPVNSPESMLGSYASAAQRAAEERWTEDLMSV